jgi:Family of unknown function (DUF6152)
MRIVWSVVATLVVALSAGPVSAHHSFAAQYDANKPVTLKGVVTKIEWTNPHARFYIDVTDTDGKVVHWNLELASPNYLKRAGWSSTSLKQGDEVTVEGSLARSGASMANARLVTFPDGTRVFARSAQDGG